MSAFGGLVLTTKGRNLQAKAQAGVQLNFIRIGVGDGELAGSSILELNALKHEVKTLSITKLKPLTGGKAAVGGLLSNQGLASGFYWREIGLFAQDPDIGEILYCYGNSGANAEYIPADSGPDILEKSIDIISIVGNAANVTATIEQSLIFATPEEIDDKIIVHENASDPHTGYIKKSLATAVNDFIVASGAGVFVKKTLAEVKTILGLGSAAYTASTAYATAAQGIKADNAATQASLDAHTADYVRQPGYGITAGSANAYTLTLTPALSAYSAGVCVAVKINVANTGASTININGLGAKTILDSKGSALISGKLKLNIVYTLRYDGTNFILQGEGGEYGTAGAPHVLSGYTIGTENGLVNGTIIARSAGDYETDGGVPSAGLLKLSVPGDAFYGNGAFITITDADFLAANIKSGVNIFGITGTNPNVSTGTAAPTGGYDGDYYIQT